MSAVGLWLADFDSGPGLKGQAVVRWEKGCEGRSFLVASAALNTPQGDMLAAPFYEMPFPSGGRSAMLRAVGCCKRALSRRQLRIVDARFTEYAPKAQSEVVPPVIPPTWRDIR